LLNENNVLVVNGEDENVMKAVNETKAKIITCGYSDKFDYYPGNIVYNNKGCATYNLMFKGSSLGEISLSVPGKHNVLNSILSAGICINYGCDIKCIQKGLAEFIGADRRFEYLGTYNNATIIDDYAHHPTELKATLETAKNINHNKIYAIFQPHTYTRTKLLLNDFAEAFYNADNVIITDIYAAREIDDGSIHSKDLVNRLVQNGVNAIYIKDFNEIKDFIKKNAAPNDIFITIGAGDVYTISKGIFTS
jgi:UDP-N-acetylmuramate--alanine ligase